MKSIDILRTIFDNVSFPVLLIDRDYKIVEANRAALSHVCQRGVDTTGRSCFKITHALERPCWHAEGVVCPVKEAFETGRFCLNGNKVTLISTRGCLRIEHWQRLE